MTAIEQILKSELPSRITGDSLVFLGRSSFEARCLVAYEELPSSSVKYRHFFISENEAKEAGDIREGLSLLPEEISQIDVSNPLQTQSKILEQINRISQLPEVTSLVVDITSFRREELLILLKEMGKLPISMLDRATFVYSIATGMGEWLSNNVTQVRPVIGYPGDMISKQSAHLVLLAGIEHHRAIAAIEAYEPSDISLGMVPIDESVSEELHDRNLQLRDYIKRHFDNVTYEFDFSARDPKNVISALERALQKNPSQNTIIAPLNTKISTLGCGVFALNNPKVQLCYAEVEFYNAKKYSSAGDKVLLVSYNSLFGR